MIKCDIIYEIPKSIYYIMHGTSQMFYHIYKVVQMVDWLFSTITPVIYNLILPYYYTLFFSREEHFALSGGQG